VGKGLEIFFGGLKNEKMEDYTMLHPFDAGNGLRIVCHRRIAKRCTGNMEGFPLEF
jgi:hypothetical protein